MKRFWEALKRWVNPPDSHSRSAPVSDAYKDQAGPRLDTIESDLREVNARLDRIEKLLKPLTS